MKTLKELIEILNKLPACDDKYDRPVLVDQGEEIFYNQVKMFIYFHTEE